MILRASLVLLLGCGPARPPDPPVAPLAAALPTSELKVPAGFRIEVYASGVEDARSLALSPAGTLFVGSRKAGKLYAIPDADGDHRGDRVIELARGLDMPNGVVFHDGALYVAAHEQLLRYDDPERRLDAPPQPVVLIDGFPNGNPEHGWKYLALGPDQKLYIPISAPCDLCDAKPPYATIARTSLQGGELELFALGVRNSVGMDWHPTTRELWFTDNGRDRMGDDVPGDELNRAPAPGLRFGYPTCHQGDVVDPELGAAGACSGTTRPELVLGPHVAAIGMRFYRGTMFPPEYRGQLLIAEHGSWDRSQPLGYRLMRVRLDAAQRPVAYEVFVEGWLRGGKPWGRPVDLLELPDGSLLVSDDTAGAVYRISYRS